MSVAPDLLLQSSPQLKPAKVQTNRPEKPAEPASRSDSSFAEVYASERKAKATEASQRSERTDKAETGEAEEAPCSQTAEPAVAESGKTLPGEAQGEETQAQEQPEEPVLDPLLLLGMGMPQPVIDDVLASTTPEGETPAVEVADDASGAVADPLAQLTQGPFVQSSTTVKLSEIGQDPAATATQDMAVIAGQSEPAVQQPLKPGAAGQRDTGKILPGQTLSPDAQLPMAKTLESQADEPALAVARLAETDSPGLDGKAEQASDLRAEGFAGKLSQLSQAISQQSAQTGRLPLVPGQPLAMNQPGWSEAAVDRVMWLSSQNLKSAEIQLDPANLGRMEVRIQMTQDQTQVTFSSPHAHVREALESQAYRLRELFTQQGMNQLDVNVSDQSLARGWQGQSAEGERRGQRTSDRSGLAEDDVQQGVIEISRAAVKTGRGLVDYYA